MLIEGMIVINVEDYNAAITFGITEYKKLWGKPATHIIMHEDIDCDLKGLERVKGKKIAKKHVIVGRPVDG